MPEETNPPESDQNACAAQGKDSGDAPSDKGYVRKSIFETTIQACKYMGVLRGSRFRYSDKVTDVLGCISILLLIGLIFSPANSFQVPLILLCDLLFLLTIIMFTINRMGILTSLSERQFVLVWDIILGAFLLGIIFSANGAMVLQHMRELAKHF